MKKRNGFYLLIYTISVSILTALFISCGKETKTVETAEKKKDTSKSSPTGTSTSGSGAGSAGKEIFYAKSKENNIACADCHSDGTNSANPLTKYFSNIQGANKRTSTYHGKFTGEDVVKNAGGATICWESYGKMKTPMTPEQISSLNEFYASVAGTNPAAEMKYETIALPTKDKTKLKEMQKIITGLKGDPAHGETVFKNACGHCHGENSTVKKVPSVLEDFEGNAKSVAFNVLLGDGAMPFFKTGSLSDQELADISAYLMQKSGK